MRQEWKVLSIEKYLLQKSTAKVISNASAEHQRRLNFNDSVISYIDIVFVGLEV